MTTMAANVIRTCSATMVALLAVGCAYQNPDAPSSTAPPTVSTSTPFSLMLGATVGMGADAGRATVSAKVQNVNGEVLPGVVVQFTTDVGTLSAASVVTGGDGIAATTITSSESASLTATAGTLTTRTLVASQPLPIPPPPTPAPTPTPGPPSPGPLTVTVSADAVTVGTQTIVSAQVVNGPPQTLSWSFGDGTTFGGISTTTAHTYGAAGSYVVGVTVRDVNGRTVSASTTAVVNAAPAPPAPAPPPGPSYTVTLVASPTTALVGGSSTLTATVVLANGATAPTSYAWDCNNNGTVDGSDVTTSINTSSCTYPTAGTITSKVTVTGSAAASGSATTTVTVSAPPPPTLTINCSSGAKASPPNTTAVASTCVANATVNGAVVSAAAIGPVDWNFGDSATTFTSTGNVSPSHQYLTPNTFTVTAKGAVVGVTGQLTASTTTIVQ